jgi:hypothetical protein
VSFLGGFLGILLGVVLVGFGFGFGFGFGLVGFLGSGFFAVFTPLVTDPLFTDALGVLGVTLLIELAVGGLATRSVLVLLILVLVAGFGFGSFLVTGVFLVAGLRLRLVGLVGEALPAAAIALLSSTSL